MARLTRRLLGCERGAELIEMALVTPVLLLLVLGIVDFGFLFQQYVVLTNAAAEGARVGTLPGYGPGDAEARVQAYAVNGGVTGVVNADARIVTLPAAGGTTWRGMQVTVTHPYTLQYIAPIMALVGGTSASTITLTARSTMRHQTAP